MRNPDHATSEHPDSRARWRRGAAVGLLAGTAAGLVFAVPGFTNASSTGQQADALVEQASDPTTTDPTTTDPEPTDPDMEGTDSSRGQSTRIRETLQDLVDDGTITAEQADAVVAQLVEHRSDRGDRERRHPRGPNQRTPGVFSETLTDLFDFDVQELREQLRDGATLAEILDTQGIDLESMLDELSAEITEHLDAAIENGRLDRSVVEERLAEARDRIMELVENGRLGRLDPED